MKKFLVIYAAATSAREQMAKATPEQATAGFDLWKRWMTKVGPALVDPGAPVGDAVKVAGGRAESTRSEIGGYSIMQAETRDALVAMLADHPHYKMPTGTIEVHELLHLPGM
jgi:hypothetical protein